MTNKIINQLKTFGPILLPLFFFLLVELAGLFYEFGLSAVGDEMTLTNATLRMLGDVSLRPAYDTFYHLPLAVYFYLPFFLVALLAMRFGGNFADWEGVREFVILETPKFLPLGRFITIICAGITIYLVYEIGRRLFGRWAGIFASWFTITSILFVQMAQFAKVWMIHTLATTLALFFITLLYQSTKPRYYHHLLVGLSLILAFGTHAIGALAGIPYVLVHYYKSGGWGQAFFLDKKFLAGVLLFWCALPGIYYLNPHGFTNYSSSFLPAFASLLPSDVRGDYVSEDLLRYSNIETSLSYKFTYYAKILLSYEPALLLLALIGFYFLWRYDQKKSLIFGSFIASYYVAISLFGDFPFYFLPVIPWLSLLGGYMVGRLFDKLPQNRRLLLGVFFLPGLYLLVIWTFVIAEPTTRILAQNWVFEHATKDSLIITNDIFIDLPESRSAVQDIIDHGGFSTTKRRYLLALPTDQYPSPSYNVVPLPHYPERSGIDKRQFNLAIVSAFSPTDLVEAKADLVELLPNREFVMVKFFRPDKKASGVSGNIINDLVMPYITLPHLQSSGPFVAIYEVKTSTISK